MAAEQNRCPETQLLLGGTSLKLAFRQTGAQCLAGNVSTGNFRPIVPLKLRKNIFDHFHNVAHPGRLASNRWFQLCEVLNISHNQTTAYHPESNGAVERLHRRLKDVLRSAQCLSNSL